MQALTHAPPGQEFRLHDGTLVPDLETMYNVLMAMPDEEFRFFVNDDKNDIASWVEHCLDERFLAASLRRTKSREKTLKKIFIHIYA